VLRPRVVPVLTLDHESMVKTTRFADPLYLGDPRNALRLFNTKQVDELVVLDITASAQGRAPDLDFVAELAGECFMPVGFGGGLSSLAEVEDLFRSGVEKVVLNTALTTEPELVAKASAAFGSQSIVASIDVRRARRGRVEVRMPGGRSARGVDPVAWAREQVERGAGEILLTAVDRDGTAKGYDLELITLVTDAVPVPVVACGGAGSREDLQAALGAGAAAAAAGRLFVTHGKHRASLVSYPTPEEIESL
jgi:cyclase